jgi:hypothetical protein
VATIDRRLEVLGQTCFGERGTRDRCLELATRCVARCEIAFRELVVKWREQVGGVVGSLAYIRFEHDPFCVRCRGRDQDQARYPPHV